MDAGHSCALLAQHILLSNSNLFSQQTTKIIVINAIVILLLILLNGFFAASEMVIVTLNETKLKANAADGDTDAQKLLPFIENQGGFLATVQVGVTFAGFLSSAFGANQIAPVIYQSIDPSRQKSYLEPIITIVITFIISYFSLVMGELVPKQIGMRNPEKYARRFVGILRFWDKLLRPFAFLLNASAKLVCYIIGIDIDKVENQVTEEEIILMTKASGETGGIQSDEAKMIYNVFELNDTDVSEIMTPRTAMIALDVKATYSEVLHSAAHERYSRIPVYEETVDNIIGVLHIKDLLRITSHERNHFNLKKHIRDPYFVPEGKSISVLFREMQQQNISLAIVIDEYGGTDGLITIEDILEEIVGDITDEYDRVDQAIEANEDGTFIIDGMLSPEEVIERIPAAASIEPEDDFDYDTIAGFVLSQLERIPEEDECPSIHVNNMKFTVLEMDEKRIAKIKLEFTESTDGTDEEKEDE